MAGRGWERRLGALAVAALTVALGAVWLLIPTYPAYDAQYGLLWGAELLEGRSPGFDDYRSPTQHPLLVALGAVLAPLGDETAGRVWIAVCFAALVALVVAMYRLGARFAGVLCGVVAAGLVASRFNFAVLASIGYVDVAYCAMVAWAAALEVERPRRGGPVWVLLGLAGLLRPEAWLLAAAYAVWMAWGRAPRAWLPAAARAGAAPLVWCAVDLAVTGDVLFSMHHTDALALELGREKPLAELPQVGLGLLLEAVKLPVLVLGVAGAVLAWRRRRAVFGVPAAMVVLTCAGYAVIATGGLPGVYRYLLVAALGFIVFAAYALSGWTALPQGSLGRRAWAVLALTALAIGTGWTAVRLDPGKALQALRERVAERADLAAVLTAPAAERALGCGVVSVPNHKLVTSVRTILDLPSGAVRARSDRSLPRQRRGLAVVVDRRIERRPSVSIWEVPSEARRIRRAPTGFRPLARTKRFAAWGRC